MRASGSGLRGTGLPGPASRDARQASAGANQQQRHRKRVATLAPNDPFPDRLPEHSLSKDTDRDRKRTDRDVVGRAYH